MTDPLHRIDTSKLRGDFLARLRGALGAAKAHGLALVATEGYRDPARSDALYAAWKAGRGPRAAPGGRSAHNFGLAADFLALRDGAVVPNSDAPEYALLEEIAQRYGLATGRHYGDGGHVELEDWELTKDVVSPAA